MHKLAAVLFVLLSAFPAWAGEFLVTEEKFMVWVQAQKIDGFEADVESLENYDNKEFTIDFMSRTAPTHLSLQISGSGNMAEMRADSAELSEVKESAIGSVKALYCIIKTMPNVSLMYVDVPQINGELRLLTSPKKSADEMKAILSTLDLKSLQ